MKAQSAENLNNSSTQVNSGESFGATTDSGDGQHQSAESQISFVLALGNFPEGEPAARTTSGAGPRPEQRSEETGSTQAIDSISFPPVENYSDRTAGNPGAGSPTTRNDGPEARERSKDPLANLPDLVITGLEPSAARAVSRTSEQAPAREAAPVARTRDAQQAEPGEEAPVGTARRRQTETAPTESTQEVAVTEQYAGPPREVGRPTAEARAESRELPPDIDKQVKKTISRLPASVAGHLAKAYDRFSDDNIA